MINFKLVEELLQDKEVNSKYQEYLESCKNSVKDYNPEVKKLKNWIMTISIGEKKNFSLKELVLGVIEAEIFSLTTTYAEILRIANEGSRQRCEEKLSQQQVERLEKSGFFEMADSFQKEEEQREREKEENDFTLEQKLLIKKFEIAVDKLNLEESRTLLKNMYVASILKDITLSKLFKKRI